ncbi:MAG TPA: hypothetical protein VK806_09660 [Bacteroidia bacterium]|jgi:hypothetical protein|nr:hypothetical protein [Bacteroidia bacterium]
MKPLLILILSLLLSIAAFGQANYSETQIKDLMKGEWFDAIDGWHELVLSYDTILDIRTHRAPPPSGIHDDWWDYTSMTSTTAKYNLTKHNGKPDSLKNSPTGYYLMIMNKKNIVTWAAVYSINRKQMELLLPNGKKLTYSRTGSFPPYEDEEELKKHGRIQILF